MLNHLIEMVIEEDNINLHVAPTMEEVNKIAFSLNGGSTCGFDGFPGMFNQLCLYVVSIDGVITWWLIYLKVILCLKVLLIPI